MRKSPVEHKVTSHYREGKWVDRYTRGHGKKPSTRGLGRMAKTGTDNRFNVTLYYVEGRESHPVQAGNYTEAVMDGFGQAEGGEMPRRVRVRRLK